MRNELCSLTAHYLSIPSQMRYRRIHKKIKLKIEENTDIFEVKKWLLRLNRYFREKKEKGR